MNPKTQKKNPRAEKVIPSKKNVWSHIFSIKSIIALVCGIVFLFISFDICPSYNWVWNQMLKGNWEVIKKYPDASLEQRSEMKLGFTFTYYNYLKQNTPEDAIILFPKPEHIVEKKNPNQSINFAQKQEITYFLYPRQVIYKDEVNNPLYGKESYVAVVNGYGYEHVDYEVNPKVEFTILPKKQNNQ